MGASVHPLSLVIRHLPAPLLAVLDAWSHRLARRRWQQRQQRWQQRQAGPAAAEQPIAYRLKPWRD
jgi:hypothetical protein